MLIEIVKQLRIAFQLLVTFTLLTGIIYPLVVTTGAQLLFPWQANGSLIEHEGQKVGSLLIGQSFTDPKYFWGRPSATPLYAYNAMYSSGANLSPTNASYLASVSARIKNLQNSDIDNKKLIPVDLVTASASGLDPDISPLSAIYQAKRIATVRDMNLDQILQLIAQHTQQCLTPILCEARINVLVLNLALDQAMITRSANRGSSSQS